MMKFQKPGLNVPVKKIEKTVTYCNHCQFPKVYKENKPDTVNWMYVCDFVNEFNRQPEGVPFVLRKGTGKNFPLILIPDNCPLENYDRKRVKPEKPEETEIDPEEEDDSEN